MSEIQHRDALAAGHQLHWYAIESILGQGGFGITYLAQDTNLDQKVAIKEFLPSEVAVRANDLTVQPRTVNETEQYKWGLERFLSEARTLARFDHPNIVRIHSVFEANNSAYLVMRYEQGVSFNDYLRRHKHLSESELLDIILPILDGLKIVHDAGFIHRDIKPANIYIRHDSTPVLLDFGAAREATGKPRTLTILIAPGYAPIEQYYSSGQEQGPWTDIYGLGATLYRAIAGVAPIDAIERSRGMLGSTRDVMVPAAVVGQGRYSERFLAAIDHALKFNEKDRPQTISEWLAELKPGTVADSKFSQPGKKPPPEKADVRIPEITDTPTAINPRTIPDRRTRIRNYSVIIILVLGTALGFTLLYLNGKEAAPPVGRPDSVAETIKLSPNNQVSTTTPIEPIQNKSDPLGGKSEPILSDSKINPVPANNIEAKDEMTSRLLDRINQLESRIDNQNHAAGEADNKERVEMKGETAKLAALRDEVKKLEGQRNEELRRLDELANAKRVTKVEIQKNGMLDKLPDKPAITAVEKTPPAGTDNALQLGLNAVSESNYDTALKLLRPLADKGDSVAQYNVAVMYRNGQGILANNNMALDMMLRAARQGLTDAQIELATMYYSGINGVRDPFLAYTWYLVAEKNDVFKVIVERRKAEGELQPEQLPQAAALATELQKKQNIFSARETTKN